MLKTPFAGLTALDPGESIQTDNASFITENPPKTDRLLRIGAVTHRHDGHAALAAPSATPGASGATTGGTIPAGLALYVGFTYNDPSGGETVISPLATVTTEDPLDPPSTPPSGTADYTGGTLPADVYYYALSYIDAEGGETPLGPSIQVEREPGHASGRIQLSGLRDPMLDAGATAWRLWRSAGGGDFFYIAQDATDTFTDEGVSCVDCGLAPVAETYNFTNGTNAVQVRVPGPLPAGASAFSLYMSPTADFASNSRHGVFGSAEVGTVLTIPDLVAEAHRPPDVSTCIPGASQIDALTDIINLASAVGGIGTGGGGSSAPIYEIGFYNAAVRGGTWIQWRPSAAASASPSPVKLLGYQVEDLQGGIVDLDFAGSAVNLAGGYARDGNGYLVPGSAVSTGQDRVAYLGGFDYFNEGDLTRHIQFTGPSDGNPDYNTTILAHPDLISYWPLNEASGGPQDLKGTNDVVAWTPDGAGSVVNNVSLGPMNGVQLRGFALAQGPDTLDQPGELPFTIEGFFVAPSAFPAGMQVDLWRKPGGGGLNHDVSVSVRSVTGDTDGYLWFGRFTDAGGTQTNSGVGSLTPGQLYYFAARYDGSEMSLVLDETESGVQPDPADPIDDSTMPWAIGTAWDNETYKMARLAFYGAALPLAELQQHRAIGLGIAGTPRWSRVGVQYGGGNNGIFGFIQASGASGTLMLASRETAGLAGPYVPFASAPVAIPASGSTRILELSRRYDHLKLTMYDGLWNELEVVEADLPDALRPAWGYWNAASAAFLGVSDTWASATAWRTDWLTYDQLTRRSRLWANMSGGEFDGWDLLTDEGTIRLPHNVYLIDNWASGYAAGWGSGMTGSPAASRDPVGNVRMSGRATKSTGSAAVAGEVIATLDLDWRPVAYDVTTWDFPVVTGDDDGQELGIVRVDQATGEIRLLAGRMTDPATKRPWVDLAPLHWQVWTA